MIYGYKTEANKLVCANCGSTLSKESEGKVRFCPKCANPLSMDAAIELEQIGKKAKIEILYALQDEMEEGKDAAATITRFLEELNQ